MTVPHSERIPQHRISTCVVLTDERGWVLLVHLSYNGRKWSLPSGMLDHNESLEASAAREVIEETGLKAKVVDVVGLYQNLAKRQLVVAFRGKVTGGKLKRRTRETSDAMYWDPSALPDNLRGTHVHVIKDALKHHKHPRLRVGE